MKISNSFKFAAVEITAEICHEANAAWCRAVGDFSQLPWDNAPDWQKESARAGVRWLLENPDAGPSALHTQWMEHKLADGWKYGPVKNAERKEHPSLVPFEALTAHEQRKDLLFASIVKALGADYNMLANSQIE